jgi:hypothetical protein
MIAFHGTYENGVVKLDEKIPALKKSKVIVTFLEEASKNSEANVLKFEQFSFSESREQTNRFKGSIADSIIEERRAAQ